MPDWLVVIILGLIEGITEFLPISSTGHLLLAQHWLQSSQSDLFTTVIQCGTVFAVVAVFYQRLRQLLGSWQLPASRQYLLKLGTAFVVTCVGGLILHALHRSLPHKATPIAWAVLIGGVCMLALEWYLQDKPLRAEITWTLAIAIGLAQVLAALFPGTSRSGATILIALAFGLQRPLAIEFSFLLGIPTLLAAGALEVYSAKKHALLGAENWSLVLLGTVISALTAFVAVKWLLRYIQTHTFYAFGWYRVALGLLILLWLR